MPTLILTLIFVVYAIGAGVVLWSAFRSKPKGRTGFRFAYVIMPVLIFILSIAITAFFYPRLPADLAYSFSGAADSYLSRGAGLFLMLGLQLLFALPLVGITLVINHLNRDNRSVTLDRTLFIMGNIAAFPQLIVCFALADIFSYNLYDSHLAPLWLFAVIILASGTVFLGILFRGALKQRAGKIAPS
ncbi:MAG: DUF1648 domain-containing protein [Dehalococcoidia bacterium]|nr:MAG: DUF1648 domain-containing protein [Dehalococcoidia bacterium]